MGSESDPDHRIATMSFGTHGLDAEDCLQDVMADVRAFSQEMGVGLPNLVIGIRTYNGGKTADNLCAVSMVERRFHSRVQANPDCPGA
jgi:hypothetical protein